MSVHVTHMQPWQHMRLLGYRPLPRPLLRGSAVPPTVGVGCEGVFLDHDRPAVVGWRRPAVPLAVEEHGLE